LIFRKTLWIALALIYAQLILGATFRHTANQFVLISHIAGALLVIFHAGFIARFVLEHVATEKRLVMPAMLLSVLARKAYLL